MNVHSVKRPAKRYSTPYNSSLDIQAYGIDNLYPQRLGDIVNASPTARGCLSRYARFIEGNGLKVMGELEVSRNGGTLDDLVHALSQDLAKFNGFAIHANFNALGEVCELTHIPFEDCRLEEPDDADYIANIVVHPDWRGQKTRNGKRVRVSADELQRFPVWNPDAVLAQIASVGGIDHFHGQVLWVSGDGAGVYPLPKYDSAVSEMSTDEGLSNVMARNVRNNFLTSGMLVSRTSQSDGDDGEGFTEAIQQLQGDERSLAIMQVTLEPGEEKPEFIPFPIRNFDKDFTATEQSIVERIYSAFEQEPFLSIRNGKLGFSGTVIHDAYDYYSAVVVKEQGLIERALKKMLDWWEIPIAQPVIIDPLKFASDADTSE